MKIVDDNGGSGGGKPTTPPTPMPELTPTPLYKDPAVIVPAVLVLGVIAYILVRVLR